MDRFEAMRVFASRLRDPDQSITRWVKWFRPLRDSCRAAAVAVRSLSRWWLIESFL
jgi:hypothetical protein